MHLLVFSICFGQLEKYNDPILNPSLVNKKRAEKLNNKGMAFYLNNKSIDENAKLFYNGKFAVSDDEKTFAICDSLTTKNAATRPFYFYVFCRILELSDGALSEVLGACCLEYTKKYPCEFIKYFGAKDFDASSKKWASFIAFELGPMSECKKFEVEIDKKIKQDCGFYTSTWNRFKKEIESMLQE